MTEELRNNFYGGHLMPYLSHEENGETILSDDEYWPTHSEYVLILSALSSDELLEYRYQLHGEDNVNLSDLKFNVADRFDWLCENLQKYCHTYTLPLTEDIVITCLKDFEKQTVAPWVESNPNYDPKDDVIDLLAIDINPK